MNKRLKTIVVTVLLSFPWVAGATTTNPASADPGVVASQVRSFPLRGHLVNWRSVGDRSLIVWVAPNQPYLLELARRSPELPFEIGIGLTSFGGRVSARFDDVIVHGWNYPIKAIYSLDQATADAISAAARLSARAGGASDAPPA